MGRARRAPAARTRLVLESGCAEPKGAAPGPRIPPLNGAATHPIRAPRLKRSPKRAPPQTPSGKVVVFGGLCAALPQPRGAPHPTPAARQSAARAARDGFAVVPLAAPAKCIAAGQQHLLISDGERVFAVGRWMDADGGEAGSAPFHSPAELLHLPAEGVAKVAAGPHSSCAVSGDGRLFLGGRLLDRHHAESVRALPAGEVLVGRDLGIAPAPQWRGRRRFRGGGGCATCTGSLQCLVALTPLPRCLRLCNTGQRANRAAHPPLTCSAPPSPPQLLQKRGVALWDPIDWDWPGFGGARLSAVPGLSGVVDAALGGWHAIVLTH